ncbi:MAG: transcriptional repressor [Bacteroidales bacterium]|nr:transcriptional repressor [Bacteroidales bacterium]MDY3913164.1 transcriptional repressor [Sodaliphilus sp.]
MSTSQDEFLHKLQLRGIKPTAMRLLILRAMTAHREAFSLQSLEDDLDTVDKSTIYRTITLFLTHHLIHAIDDGTGSLKYAVCANSCHCGEDDSDIGDLHAHFYCERCHRTFCLNSIHVPVVTLPGAFEVHSINYVLKGLCSECSVKTHDAHDCR